MEFQKAEIVFYVFVSIAGLVGGIVRLCRDNISYGVIGNIGRCLSAGLVAFGATGLWIGPDTSSLTGPFYYLAAASLIGFSGSDIQDKIFNRAVSKLQEKFGLIDRKDDQP